MWDLSDCAQTEKRKQFKATALKPGTDTNRTGLFTTAVNEDRNRFKLRLLTQVV